MAEAWRTGARRAATQIAERAGTERAFRGTLIAPDLVAVRLQQASHVPGSGPVPTRDVLRAAVEGLGFELEVERRVVRGERGVEVVYAGTTTTVETMSGAPSSRLVRPSTGTGSAVEATPRSIARLATPA